MRILITGATGLIGSALADRLASAGHELLLVVRDVESARNRWPNADVRHGGFGGNMDWTPHLAGVEVVINAVGIFSEKGSQTFDAVHVKGPGALFRAAVDAGVRRIVQISALGAHPYADVAYLSSKGRADAQLATLPVASTIVQPSLVFSPGGASTQWFSALAVLPVTPLPGRGGQRVQPVHIDDLADAVVRIATQGDAPPELRAVGPEPVTLRRYLDVLKRSLGSGGSFVPVPVVAMRWMGRVLGRWIPWLSADTMTMLALGSIADASGMARVLGRSPRPVDSFIDEDSRAALRRAAMLFWLRPLLRWSIAWMWIATAVVSLFVYPTEESLALLARTGLHGNAAIVALIGAAALDAVLGVALFMPRWRRAAYTVQFLLVAGYTLIISVFLPEFWAHPYGPVLKNIPLLAAIALARELDAPHGRHHR